MFRVFDTLFRFFGRSIFTPILLGWMIGAVLFGAIVGLLVATPFIFAFYDQQPGESAWQWLVFGPFMFIGAVFGFQYWRKASEADAFFGTTHVLDPFEVSGQPSAAYNPLDRLTPDSLDLGEDAASLTVALVMDPPGQVSEAH